MLITWACNRGDGAFFTYLNLFIGCLSPVKCLVIIVKGQGSELPAHMRSTDMSDLNITTRNPDTRIPFDPHNSRNTCF